MMEQWRTWLSSLDGLFVQDALSSILAILFMLVVTAIISAFVRSLLKRSLKTTNKEIIIKITRIVIWCIGILLATRQIKGLEDLAVFLFSSSGVIVVVFGLAAQDAIGNVISGVFIAWNKPFEVGDYVRCVDNNAEGFVERIELRHTVLRTFENHNYIVPNQTMNSSVIENYTKGDTQCVFLDIGISYDSDIDQAISLIKEIVQQHPYFYDHRTASEKKNDADAVTVRVQELGEYAICLRTILWIRKFEQKSQYLSDIRKAVKQKFDEVGIEIPYPYQNQILITKK
ncbi:MAG: mechanosensitive ion channel family protein [Erysipelotrichaceae bacterium]|nr:mechanosensitive ion channel family protein [Erysipelotrichaceae bacterium]